METVLATRERNASESGEVAEIIRVARCPPAEWPVKWIGPAIMLAAAAIAAPISRVIPEMRVCGHSV